jgi:hypothetical protein
MALNSFMEIRAVPIRDQKTPTDRWGNPRYILRITEPPELRGLIAFPIDEDIIIPGKEYVVEIIKRCERCVKVKINRTERYEIPVRKGAWNVHEVWYKLDTMRPAPQMPTIEKLYVALWDRNAYEDYFIAKSKGNPCELHCSQTETSVLDDDVWPGTKTTSCRRGDWLGRWRCTFSASTDVIDFLWYVDKVYKSEQEALEAYKNLLNRYNEDLRKYEEEVKRLNAMYEDARSDKIMIADNMGIHLMSVCDL